jgi:glutaredoxin
MPGMKDDGMNNDAPAAARPPRRLIVLALVVIAGALGAQWWHTRSYQRFGAEMAALARPGDIHMLASRDCEGCEVARAWMRQYQVRFTECNIDTDASCQEAFRASGIEKTPAITVRGEWQYGFKPQRIFDRLRTRA